jgi:hypothetical protein
VDGLGECSGAQGGSGGALGPAGSRACDGMDALLDVGPTGRVAGAAVALGGVEGRGAGVGHQDRCAVDPHGISGLSASTITSSAARTVTPTPPAARPPTPRCSRSPRPRRASRIEPGPVAEPDSGYGAGFTGHGTMVMPRLGLAGNSHLAFPNGGLGASDKPSDNGARRR